LKILKDASQVVFTFQSMYDRYHAHNVSCHVNCDNNCTHECLVSTCNFGPQHTARHESSSAKCCCRPSVQSLHAAAMSAFRSLGLVSSAVVRLAACSPIAQSVKAAQITTVVSNCSHSFGRYVDCIGAISRSHCVHLAYSFSLGK